MKKHNLVTYLFVIICLTFAFVVFIKFNPKALLKKEDNPITLKNISSNSQSSFLGKAAGKDINHILNKRILKI